MKPSVVIPTLIVGVFLGFLAGYLFPRLQESSQQTDVISQASSANPDLNFAHCKRTPADSVQDCIDGVLAADAVTSGSSRSCNGIVNTSVRSQCLARVELLSSLDEGTSAFCKGLSSDPLCVDLATILNAQVSQKRELCFSVGNEKLRDVCSSLFPSVDLPAEPTNVIKAYGLRCPAGVKACADAVGPFNAAISAKSEQQCGALGMFKDFCLNELSLYRGYTENNASLCSARLSESECRLQLAIARALDGKPELCTALSDTNEANICKLEVEGSNGEKRFGYLTK